MSREEEGEIFFEDGVKGKVSEVCETEVRDLGHDGVEEENEAHGKEESPASVLDDCSGYEAGEVVEDGGTEKDKVELSGDVPLNFTAPDSPQ